MMEMSERLYQHYQCPVCGRRMVHDMAVFLTHARAHMLDLLLKNDPEWEAKNWEGLRLL